MKNKVLELVKAICETNSTDCRGLNHAELARELMNLANVPASAKIQEIPLDWNNQVVVLFLMPDDNNYYSLFAGLGNDGNFYFELSITGTLQENGYFDFFEKDEILEIDFFIKQYTTYEQTADKEYTGQADTRTMHDWFLYYLQYVDSTDYPDFITWFFDMLKSGNLIEEKEEKEEK